MTYNSFSTRVHGRKNGERHLFSSLPLSSCSGDTRGKRLSVLFFRSSRKSILPIAVAFVFALAIPANIHAQGGRGGRGGPPPIPKAAAPFDPSGYWTSIVTEDWHVRMLVATKGDFGSGPNAEELPFGGGGSIPYTAEGKKLALAWDPAKDEAEGNQCKAYGAAGIMRLPGHLHITWQDDYTLKMDIDAGNQTRLFKFKRPTQPGQAATATEPAGEPSLQGNSVAEWIILGGRGDWSRGGNLKVVTTNLKPGYFWKNGMVYSGKLTLTEHYRYQKEPNGDEWLNFSQQADDPQYLTEPWIITYHYKKLPDASRWHPAACTVK